MRGQLNIFPKVMFVFLIAAVVFFANVLVVNAYDKYWEQRERLNALQVLKINAEKNWTFLGYEGKEFSVGSFHSGREDIAKIKGIMDVVCLNEKRMFETVYVENEINISDKKICSKEMCYNLKCSAIDATLLPGAHHLLVVIEEGKVRVLE
ncbi:MAG: hypothetical protein ACPL06_03375 [Candidatus Anstonellales archaeon]